MYNFIVIVSLFYIDNTMTTPILGVVIFLRKAIYCLK